MGKTYKTSRNKTTPISEKINSIGLLRNLENILPQIISEYDKVIREWTELHEENIMLKRKILGLETQVINLKEKDEKRYRNDTY